MQTKKDVVEYYNECAVDYQMMWFNEETLAIHYGYWDEKTKKHHDSLLHMNNQLLKIANIKNTDYVLDAGCGVGGSSIWLAKEVGSKVIGIDLCKKNVDTAKAFARKYEVDDLVCFETRDYEDTNYGDNRFDVVWSLESVCHAQDKKRFLEETFRILKSGGRFIMADGFKRREPKNEEEEKIYDMWCKGWVVPHLTTMREFCKCMEEVGFKNIYVRDITSNVFRSALRIRNIGRMIYYPGIFMEKIGLRTKRQTMNIIAGLNQYEILRRRIGRYCIFCGEKC